MFRSPKLTRSYFFVFTGIIALLVLSFGAFLVAQEYLRFSRRAASLESDYMDSQMRSLKAKVKAALDIIEARKREEEARYKEDVKAWVYGAYSVAAHINDERRDDKDLDKIKALVKEAFKSFRFDNGSGYIFAMSLDGKKQFFFGGPESEKQRLFGIDKADAQHVIQDMIEAVKESGEDFYIYTGTEPGEEQGYFSEIVFIKHFKAFDWLIGAGKNPDDIDDEEIKNIALASLGEISDGDDWHILVLDCEGKVLMNSAHEDCLPGDSLTDGAAVEVQIPHNIKEVCKGPTGEWVKYVSKDRNNTNDEISGILYAKAVDDWGWIVCAEADADKIEKIISGNRRGLEMMIRKQVVFIMSLFLIFLFMAVLIGKLFARKVGKQFWIFIRFFKMAAIRYRKIDTGSLFFREFRILADSANKMVKDREEARRALREGEEKYRSFVERASDGFIIVQSTLIKYINPVVTSVTGYSSEELINTPFSRYVHPSEVSAFMKNYKMRMDGKSVPPIFETRIMHKDGRYINIEVNAGKIMYKGMSASLLITRDITARKREEEKKRQLDEQIRHTQKLESLEILAGGIAHDFNNLLMGILGNADLAMRELSENPSSLNRLRLIEISAERAADLTKQLLAYSGKGTFVMQPFNLSRLVEEIEDLLGTATKKKAELKFNLFSDLPAIEGDATQIRQVVVNLITNASEAMEDQYGVIELSTGTVICDTQKLNDMFTGKDLPEGTYVYLKVSDTGCGIEKDAIPRIFDPFFTTKFTGRGLGLAAVLGIVLGHKGTLKVESEPGQGTTFTVLFPRSEKSVKPAEEVQPLHEDWTGKGTILVVDDEEQVRDVVTTILKDIGFDILTACDGLEALEMFRRHQDNIAVVLLDMTMPNMDGEEAFHELRKIRSDVRVIISSGYDQQDVISHFTGEGLAGFIQKSYKFEDLIAAIRAALENREMVNCT